MHVQKALAIATCSRMAMIGIMTKPLPISDKKSTKVTISTFPDSGMISENESFGVDLSKLNSGN